VTNTLKPGSTRGGLTQELGQDPRRRFMAEIELAIVSDTRATIANARMTTTTAPALLRQQIYMQLGCQTQLLDYQ